MLNQPQMGGGGGQVWAVRGEDENPRGGQESV